MPVEVQAIAERLVGQLGQVGVVTVEVDGRWYVSPSRTLTDVLLVGMQGLEGDDIETHAEEIEEQRTEIEEQATDSVEAADDATARRSKDD